MDESGCLGFDFSKKKTSKNFVISFLFVRNKRALEKAVRKTFRAMSEKEKRNHTGTLHCNKESRRTRLKLLTLISKVENVSIISIKLNKKKVDKNLHNKKSELYNYVVRILIDRAFSKNLIPVNGSVKLIASKRETNKFLNENFKSYIKSQVLEKHSMQLDIQITPSHGEKLLQAVDFVSWSLFRKYEHNDNSYYDVIKDKILKEEDLFK